ncbi:putative membrane protein [Chitinophaga niastensis]|uniref:Putative membrane protein n=1 Tax=Chitinophaga niastensis TaxID=536980 RepID=A0A2P8HF42_CHINA|nr:c-type cytochrome domain-containing protein [Chitinophaga niastensis]PSL44826.1 putative membrane protein [Chitinophaga niastensis]
MKLLLSSGSWSMFIGRSHPLLVHLPIGILIIAFVLAMLAQRQKWAHLKSALPLVLLAAALSAVISCITGYLLSLDGGYDEHLLQTHKLLGIGVAVISIVLYILEKTNNRFSRLQVPVALLMILLLSAAGHYGGTLTHGDDYLTQAMPAGLRKLTGMSNTATNVAAYTDIGDAKLYEDLVRPVLTARCYGCHNEQKLKGGLRLESVALIRKGGEHGPVLKNGLPEESELFKRLILPEEDEHRMPPKGKPQVAPQELELLYWWIAQGAPVGKTVKELTKTPRILAVLAGMQPPPALDKNEFVPENMVSKASGNSIAALAAKGVKVLPVAAGSNYLAVNCINAIDFKDADMALLLPLKEQLIWLDISGTHVTDAAIPVIAKFSKLTRLEIKNTVVKGDHLDQLGACTELRYLNLTGTATADAGVLSLRKNKKLQQVYLYQAGVKPATIQQLQQSMPKLRIDTGGYLQQLPSDTIIYKKISV